MLNSLLALQSSRGRRGPRRLSRGSEGLRGATPSLPPELSRRCCEGLRAPPVPRHFMQAVSLCQKAPQGKKSLSQTDFMGGFQRAQKAKQGTCLGSLSKLDPSREGSPRAHAPTSPILPSRVKTKPFLPMAVAGAWRCCTVGAGDPVGSCQKSVKVSHAWS